MATSRNGQDLYHQRGTEGRREQILHAAAAVFAQHGYHGARTRDIAEAAGVAEGTIYNYYDSKRHLLLALIEHTVTESMPEVAANSDPQDLEALITALLTDRLETLRRNRSLFKAVVPEMITDRELRADYLQQVVLPMADHLTRLAERAVATGHARPFNPYVVFPAILGAITATFLLNEVLRLPLPETGDGELVSELANLFLHGLQASGRQGA
jgi:AcrR family transcriptional regulator